MLRIHLFDFTVPLDNKMSNWKIATLVPDPIPTPEEATENKVREDFWQKIIALVSATNYI